MTLDEIIEFKDKLISADIELHRDMIILYDGDEIPPEFDNMFEVEYMSVKIVKRINYKNAISNLYNKMDI